MKFKDLSEFLKKIEETPSRNDMSSLLANFLKDCDEEEVQYISYLIQGRVAPMFVNAEFNYSEKSLINLLKEFVSTSGITFDVEKEREVSGDIGDTTQKVMQEISSVGGKYSVKEIYELLWDIMNIKGAGAVSRKNTLIINCLKNLSPVESKFFTRIVCGELRLGLNIRTLLDVYSIALTGSKGLRTLLDHAYGVTADIGYIARICFGDKDYENSLKNIKIVPGTPVLSRLVERVGSFEEVFERFEGTILVQPKFDGLRCQIHKWSNELTSKLEKPIWRQYYENGNANTSMDLFSESKKSSEIRLFTRNLEDVTEMFPEIVESAMKIDVDSFVLDSEILGWNYQADTFLSYQETMQRRRKYFVGKKSEEIPVQAMIFDLLYFKDEDLATKDTEKRVELLNKYFPNTPIGIKLATTKKISDISGLQDYFNECVRNGLEGVIVKQLGGGYKPGIRNFEWIKLKKSMNKKLVDTVDLTVIGYYVGSGRRSSLGVGAILGAVYNESLETFDAVSKIGTGMSDELLKEIFSSLDKLEVKKMPKNVRCEESIKPDVWVEPKFVVTVEADEITRKITKSKEDIGGGLSLRFPRLIEFGRDKNPEDSTSVNELKNMYKISRKNSK